MKLTIERLTVLSPQDKLDLVKIWPAVDIDALQQQLTDSNVLFAARFNDRLLGAVQVEIDAAWGEGRLMGLCVRPETRRRGVGLYLLAETRRQMPDIVSWWLSNQQPLEDATLLGKFLSACGFSEEPDGWHLR
ncbi:aspartate 1-decarboxylase autocleavage activator PanM [Candidatus Sodalis sp. SoCistrobi]|uniref:aspartate 1-decarboxylase autocleavage activator PanM n=1 Tax=Candidatus Sodalis sp. SoCistrobi TaxID=1922216 RepID=UPI0009399E7E|nr:aspartate 1-decarboxylase autocleavage activator PanM [Candidatus Sodalis sp. SoCistrobi]